MLTLKLAFRNLFRNTRRSVLTIMLIGFSLSALILTDAIMHGMITLMVENVTGTISGEAQVHHKNYREDFNVDLVIENSSEVELVLRQDSSVKHHAARVISGGMISSSYNVNGGMFYGVDAQNEQHISKIKAAVIRGEYLSGKDGQLLMGQSMADLLEVDLGDRIVITLSEFKTGEMTQALFRVSGILHFGMRELDDNVVFININPARKALGLSNEQSHEFAMTFHNPEDAKHRETAIFQQLNRGELEAMGWLDLNKQIALMIEMSGFTSLISGTVLFLLASLGVINSMFMSIYERIYEFGVIKAIGTRPASLSRLILCEAFLLAIISCVFGMLVAYGVGSWTAVNGIPLGEFEFEGIAISNNIMTEFHSNQFIQFPIYVTILTIVAALYPARFAARIIPTEALQRSL